MEVSRSVLIHDLDDDDSRVNFTGESLGNQSRCSMCDVVQVITDNGSVWFFQLLIW